MTTLTLLNISYLATLVIGLLIGYVVGVGLTEGKTDRRYHKVLKDNNLEEP